MNARCLRLATALLLALTVPSLVLAAEAENKPTETSAAEAPCPAYNPLRSVWKSEPTCASRVWAWLTYQPLHQPNKCCKITAMPCCAPRNYWFFPCVNAYGQCSTGGYATKSCGCQ